jgi:hypothetical protein
MEPGNPPQLVGYRTSRGTFIDLVTQVPWGCDTKIMVAARPKDGKGLVERRVAVDPTTTLIYYVVETDLINVVIDFPEQVARWTAHDWDQWFKLNQKRTANAGETAAENVHAVGDLPTEGFKYATSQDMEPIAAAAVASGQAIVMMGPQPRVIPRGLPPIGSGTKPVAGQIHDLTDNVTVGAPGPTPTRAAPARTPIPGDADFVGPVGPGGWRMTSRGMGAHMVERVNVRGRAGLAALDQAGTPRFYPSGTAEAAGAAHQRLHAATNNAGIALREGGNAAMTDAELLARYRKAYSDPSLAGIRRDLRTLNGQTTLATNVTPAEAFEALMRWFARQ